MKKFYMRM